VRAERALLAALGGSCHSPVAVLGSCEGDELTLRAAVFSADGSSRIERSIAFSIADGDGPTALAASLLADAPETITALFSGPPQ
jgi:hydroxymethylbilane synthase